MDFLDETGTRYQLTETTDEIENSKKSRVWSWVLGSLVLVGGVAWLATTSQRKSNPASSELDALINHIKNPETDWSRLKELDGHPDVEVHRAMLENPNICPVQENGRLNTTLLMELAKKIPDEVAEHPVFILHALIEPDKDMDSVVAMILKRTSNVGLIDRLWSNWNHSFSVRESVAGNQKTPVEILEVLGNEKTETDLDVRIAVAENPSTPEKVLRVLGNQSTESEPEVRRIVARRDTTPKDVLVILGGDDTETDFSVKLFVASNPNTPENILWQLSAKPDSDWRYRNAVLSNPNTPRNLLMLLDAGV